MLGKALGGRLNASIMHQNLRSLLMHVSRHVHPKQCDTLAKSALPQFSEQLQGKCVELQVVQAAPSSKPQPGSIPAANQPHTIPQHGGPLPATAGTSAGLHPAHTQNKAYMNGHIQQLAAHSTQPSNSSVSLANGH